MPAFRWLCAGQAVSLLGDQLLPVAVAALVVENGGSAADLGRVFAARFAALVIFALLGGAWADRLPRVRVLRGADVLRLVVVATLVGFCARTTPGVNVLAALVFFVGAGEAFFRPAYGALLPTILPEASLPAGNAMSEVTSYLAQVAGPGIAGALLLVTQPSTVFAIDAVTFAISLATLLRVGEPTWEAPQRRPMRREITEGFAAVRARPWIAAILAMASVQLLVAVAPAVVLLPLALRDSGASPSSYGLVLAVGAMGGLAGAIVAGRWNPVHPGWVAMPALVLWALVPLALLWHAPLMVLAGAWLLAQAGLAPFTVWWGTALQRDIPREVLARVVSVDWLCSFGLLPLGLALVGPAVDRVGRGPLLAAGAGVTLVTSLLPLAVPGVGDLRTVGTDGLDARSGVGP